MIIPFAILCDGPSLEDWQLDCLEKLCSVAGEARAKLLAGSAQLPEVIARAHEWAFVLSFSAERGTAALIDALIDAPAYGVWAFRWGDAQYDRAGPSGFWEVYERSPLTVARLVRLVHGDQAAIVLREGYFRTHPHSIACNRAELTARTTRWPAQVCGDIVNGVTARLTATPQAFGGERPAPSRLQRFRCRGRILVRMVGTLMRSLFRHDQWNVGCIHRPIASFLTAPVSSTTEWLPPSARAEFKADPFGVQRDGTLTILYEHFSYRSNLGIIAAIDSSAVASGATSGARGMRVEVGPRPAVHLSYPYLIEVEGRLLCIPESHRAHEVGLYEIERFPDQWTKIADLLRGVDVVDATLFRYEGRWWLAGSEPTAQGTTCELNLWYSTELCGPYRAHAGNPVKLDVRSARPGGTPFLHEGMLYRPAQDCSSTYGGRVIINRIVSLTPTAFDEVPAAILSPERGGPYPAGLHTLSQVGDSTLIDGKRVIFSPAEFRRVLVHYVRSALRPLSKSR